MHKLHPRYSSCIDLIENVIKCNVKDSDVHMESSPTETVPQSQCEVTEVPVQSVCVTVLINGNAADADLSYPETVGRIHINDTECYISPCILPRLRGESFAPLMRIAAERQVCISMVSLKIHCCHLLLLGSIILAAQRSQASECFSCQMMAVS